MTIPASANVWTGEPTPEQLSRISRGILAEPFNPALIASGAALTDGSLFGTLVPLYAGDVASGVEFVVTQAGAGTVPTSFFGALLDLVGNRLAVTADSKASASLTATGFKSLSFATAYTVPTSGSYYACLLEVGAFGSTVLNLGRLAGATGVGSALGSNASPAVVQTGQTAVPNPAVLTASGTLFYVGII